MSEYRIERPMLNVEKAASFMTRSIPSQKD